MNEITATLLNHSTGLVLAVFLFSLGINKFFWSSLEKKMLSKDDLKKELETVSGAMEELDKNVETRLLRFEGMFSDRLSDVNKRIDILYQVNKNISRVK